VSKLNDLDKRVLGALTGRDRIKALLSERGLSLTAFAEKHNLWVENVSRCISGDRTLPDIRAKLADELALPQATIDTLIEG